MPPGDPQRIHIGVNSGGGVHWNGSLDEIRVFTFEGDFDPNSLLVTGGLPASGPSDIKSTFGGFPLLRVDETAEATLLLQNTGTDDLVIEALDLNGDQVAAFALSADAPVLPITLPSLEVARVPITFTPNGVAGIQHAEIRITSNDPDPLDPDSVVALAGQAWRTDGLSLHWPLDDLEPAAAMDLSGNELTGTFIDGGSWVFGEESIAGSEGTAVLSGDEGSTYMVSAPPHTASFTYSVWLKPDTGGVLSHQTRDLAQRSKSMFDMELSEEVSRTLFINERQLFITDPGTVFPEEEITSGASAAVELVFDPQGQPGTFTGQLAISSNDESQPERLVNLRLNVDALPILGAHYPMDESDGMQLGDISGKDRQGDYVSAAGGNYQLGQAGLATGTSVRFDDAAGAGVGFAQVDRFGAFDQFTLSFWAQEAADGEAGAVLAAQGSPERGEAPIWAVAIIEGSLKLLLDGVPAGSGSTLGADQAHHLVLSYQKSDPEAAGADFLALFVDGQEVERISGLSALDVDAGFPIYFGAYGGILGFNGTMDDVQFYTKVLNEDARNFLTQNYGATLASFGALDSDTDGLTDEEEIALGTDPTRPDTDGDGLLDGRETNMGTFVDSNDTGTDPLNIDSDGDTIPDGIEVTESTSPVSGDDAPAVFVVRNLAYASGFADIDAVVERIASGAPTLAESVTGNFTINFTDSGSGNFTDGEVSFPVFGEAGDNDNFAIHARGVADIAETADWTFGVNSDDGFRLLIDGNAVSEFAAARGSEDTFVTVRLQAGKHAFELFYFENGGGAQVELFQSTSVDAFSGMPAEDIVFDPEQFAPVQAASPTADTFEPEPSGDLAITSVSLSEDGANVNLSWSSQEGVVYVIEGSTTATSDSWTAIGESITGQAKATSASVAKPAEPLQIYRLRRAE